MARKCMIPEGLTTPSPSRPPSGPRPCARCRRVGPGQDASPGHVCGLGHALAGPIGRRFRGNTPARASLVGYVRHSPLCTYLFVVSLSFAAAICSEAACTPKQVDMSESSDSTYDSAFDYDDVEHELLLEAASRTP